MRRVANRRPAFTLIELIVVIGIIALLATLSAAAVMRVQESQREANTNKGLLKAQMGLDQQGKAAADRIKTEEPDDVVYTMTAQPDGTRNKARAKALHMKLRLRQEFPQTYAEVRYSYPGMPQSFLQKYGPVPVYTSAIGGGNGTPTTEAAALLLVVLAKNRGGVTFNAEETGSVQVVEIPGKSMKALVDAWGNPICLRRWATDAEMAATNNELNRPPFVVPNAMNWYDPADPDGTLRGNWGPPNAKSTAEAWFKQPLNGTINDPFDGVNRGPFVMSAGKDKQYVTADDIFSFRIQSMGKGN